ncbi:ATP-grasp domain-containing protein [Acaryochloris marina NIES-2412]|uniref:ATP-grasp domain-containing protein n=1 Tax=Acaryochloris marina TaxID=155978 RepID=UPI004058A86F
MKIFNHDIMNCTHEQVQGNYLYSGRVLGLTEPDDVIQLHPELKSEWQAITEHYRRMGLHHTHQVVWDISLSRIAENPELERSVFYFGDAVNQESSYAEQCRQLDQNWYGVVDYVNSKNNFMDLAHTLGVTVPQTLCFDDKSAIDLDADIPYPCYLKPSISVDGMGIVRCEDEPQLAIALRGLPDYMPFQIQEEVRATSFLNLQYQVTPEGVKPLAASEQILDGCAHSGNRYPTIHQPWDVVEPMAQWMGQQGMKDIFAFDVAVAEKEEGPCYLAIECNPRFNGASYPTGIAHKLNISSWTSQTFMTSSRSLHQLDLTDIEYDSHTQQGIVIVNWGSILIGKLVILLAGTPEQQNRLREQLQQRL